MRIYGRNLSKSFEDKLILNDYSWTFLLEKDFTVRASGSGKSTLFKILSGEDTEFSEIYILKMKKELVMNHPITRCL